MPRSKTGNVETRKNVTRVKQTDSSGIKVRPTSDLRYKLKWSRRSIGSNRHFLFNVCREEKRQVNVEEIIFCARYSRHKSEFVSSRFEEDVARNFAEVKLLGVSRKVKRRKPGSRGRRRGLSDIIAGSWKRDAAVAGGLSCVRRRVAPTFVQVNFNSPLQTRGCMPPFRRLERPLGILGWVYCVSTFNSYIVPIDDNVTRWKITRRKIFYSLLRDEIVSSTYSDNNV